jgi:cytochrome P450
MTDPSSLSPYDPTSPESLADPFPEYARRRQAGCPIAPVESLEVPFWALFGYDDIRGALLAPKTFSNRYGNTPVFQKSIGFFADAPSHTHFRAIFRKRLSPESLTALKPQVEALAERLLTDMLAKGPLVDLHDDFALPLPVRIVSILLGIPGDDYPRLKHWSDALMDNAFGKDNQAFLDVYQGVCAFFDGFLDERWAMLAAAGIETPVPDHVGTVLPDDWISDAICADYMGRKLTRDEQRIALMGLLVGGNETTTSLITNVMWRLLERPERWEQVKAEPDRLIPVAIEESLRFDAPTLGTFRTTLCPVEVAGVQIGAKQKLMMAYGAANRDPKAFEDPETFRLDRDIKTVSRHLAFGAGPHSCPGAPLSRMEVAIVLRLFVQRMPEVALAGPAERSVGYNFWGRRSLPLRIG